jgi:hypothetical protein
MNAGSSLGSHTLPRYSRVVSVSTVAGKVLILPRLSARRMHRFQPEAANTRVWGANAIGSLEAVFESSDVERFVWILMEV